MKIQILTSAVKDLEEGRIFYEKQGGGLGDYFFDTLFSAVDSFRFPYAIYYKIENEKIVTVWRVLDCRKDPKKIEKALWKKRS